MASRFQDAPLVTAPSYPDAVAWSPENLIAVASGHLVIILNPALPSGPRGLITIPNAEPYQIGIVRREDLLTGGLLPSCLKRDRQPCVRSLSWSDIGMSPNYGCLLAVCTAEGRVKLYRPPYSEFSAEWIEIVDVSNMLYEYLSCISFGELDNPPTVLSKESLVQPEFEGDEQTIISRASKKRRACVNKMLKADLQDKSYTDQPSCSKQEKKQVLVETNEQTSNTQRVLSLRKAQKKCTVEISPQKYVSRDAMLSSLSVAWSSLLSFSSKTSSHENMLRFSLLAIGSKFGGVSVWKVYAPECYYIVRSNVSPNVKHIGMIQAHNSWVSTLSWGIVGSDSSNPQLLLVTGSSDGSVKIWTSNNEDLLKSSEACKSSFSLLKQVLLANPVSISTLSLVVHNHSDTMHLAIGKGSGSFEVWVCEISACKFKRLGSSDAHDQVITGLAWAFDGRCLYSCSQDNYLRNWILRENTISEVPLPSNNPGPIGTTEISDEFLSCLGVALSPGNLAVALVRSFNVGLLDQMYQARSQKAAVEFLWNGAQQLGEFEDSSETISEACVDLTKNDLACWESNFLWSLKKLEESTKPLVIWDIIAAMLAFRRSMPEFIELVVTEWLSVSYLGYQSDMPTEVLLPEISKRFSGVPSRLLQILNVISRCIMLSELKTDEINGKLQERKTNGEEDIGLWLEMLEKSERELRERLVGLSFSAYLIGESRLAADSPCLRRWHPTGLAQMQQWVEMNRICIRSQLETLAADVKSHLTRSRSTENEAEEKCPYCSAPVHFHSPDEAFCQSIHEDKNKSRSKNKSRNKDKERNEDKSDQRHKLERCCVSMQVCPPSPLWFCKCCHRFSSKLVPETLFALPSFSTDCKSLPESSFSDVLAKPICPFCGVLMQRKQPEFLLSASPV